MNQKALAVISFGTTYTLAQDAIMQIESTLSCHVKEYDCFRAFTSKMVIAKLKREQGQYVLTPEELMEQLYQKGYKEVLCQPLHIINGFEFEKMYKALSAFTDKFDKIQIGRPLLTFEDDYKACCDIVMKYAPAPKEAYLLPLVLCSKRRNSFGIYGTWNRTLRKRLLLSAGKYLPCIGTRACLCRYGRRISKS